MEESVYLTVDHLDNFGGPSGLKTGDFLVLRKDHDNIYDDEAIAVYGSHGNKCGYVANSVGSVARGTYSAGRIYDLIGEEAACLIRFIIGDSMIAELVENNNSEDMRF